MAWTATLEPNNVMIAKGAIRIGTSATSSTWIGLSSGNIRIRQEVETTPLVSDQLRGEYDEEVTLTRYFVETEIDEATLYNLCLHWGLPSSAVSASSILVIKPAYQPSRWLEVATFSPGTGPAAREDRYYRFNNVKTYSAAEHALSRVDKLVYSTTFKAYIDKDEEFGQVLQESGEAAPNW